jgi:hypothetical protein
VRDRHDDGAGHQVVGGAGGGWQDRGGRGTGELGGWSGVWVCAEAPDSGAGTGASQKASPRPVRIRMRRMGEG